MNYNFSVNLAVNNPATLVVQMVSELKKLSIAVSKLTGTIDTLELSLSRLRLNIFASNLHDTLQIDSDRKAKAVGPENASTNGSGIIQNEVIEAATDIGKLGEATKKVVESLDGLPKGLSKVPAAFEIPSGIASAVQGYIDLATKENTTVAEKISIGSNILIGAAVKAFAALEFGLPGLVAVAVVEAITTYMSIANENTRKQRQVEAVQRKQYEQAMRTFVMNEDDSDAYISNIVGLPLRHRWKIKSKPTDEVIKTHGHHAYDLTIPIPIQTTDQLNPRLYMPAAVKYDTRSDKLPRERSYFEKTFGLRRSLTSVGMTGGNQAFVQSTIEARERAKQYDLIHHTNTLARTELTIKEVAYDLLNRANGGRMVPDGVPMAGRARSTSAEQGKTVIINLNRGLVEHFVINTSDAKEGTGKLKEQVEQALLEVLNSVTN